MLRKVKGVKMQDIINLIVNNGLGVFCVAYLIYFQNTTMKEISKNMQENNKVLQSLTEDIKDIKEKVEK